MLLNWIKVKALLSGLNNINDEKLADIIIDFQKREFGKEADKAAGAVSDKLIRIALTINKKRPI